MAMKRFFLFAGYDGDMTEEGANTFRGDFKSVAKVVEYVEEVGWGHGGSWWNALDVKTGKVIDPELRGDDEDLMDWAKQVDSDTAAMR